MKMMDCVEVVVEKEEYAKEGIHKGMQGVIWDREKKNGCWLVLIPQYGDKEDIADLYIFEEDLCYLPNGMNPKINERIKAEHENVSKAKGEDLSGYMI